VLGQGVQKAWLNRQLETHARFIESHLAENSWFAGDALSMADIQMSFPIFACWRAAVLKTCRIFRHGRKVEMRPGWQRTLEQGGPFIIPGEG
jgi:glutathione S-transferase